MLWLGLTHWFLSCTRAYFLCDILWPEVQSHSDISHMHAIGPRSAHALTQARPTMSCIHLVLKFVNDGIYPINSLGSSLVHKQ